MTKHYLIPDAQVKAGVNTDHLEWCGKYIVDQKPDVVICIGDFADMPSLSSYDVGKKSFEGRTYRADIDAAKAGMERLMRPIFDEKLRIARRRLKKWNPRMVMCLGNHEHRIIRAIDDDRKLDGLIAIDDLGYADYGWEVHPFREVVVIDGVCYSHYFVSGQKQLAIATARNLIMKKHMSCVAGHLQGNDIAYAFRGDGVRIVGIIAGSFYSHNEEYMGPQGNKHWRGVYVFHEVNGDGAFDEMPVSLNFLRRKYGT